MYLVQKVYALYKIHKLNIDLNKAGINLKDVARYENEKANYNVEKANYNVFYISDKEDD